MKGNVANKSHGLSIQVTRVSALNQPSFYAANIKVGAILSIPVNEP